MILRNVLLVVAIFLLGLLAIPVFLAFMVFGAQEALIAFGTWMMRVGRDLLGIEVEVRGLERLDPAKPYVFMSNHESFLDGPMIVSVVRRPVRFIVKRFVVQIPVMGPGMLFVGYVPVDRMGAGQGRRSIGRAVRLVRTRGYSFLVFPEGTRSHDGTLLPFRRGGFFLAIESGAAIVPVTIHGTHELMPRGTRLVRRGRVRIDIHEPVPADGYARETMDALMEKVRETIRGHIT